jgi:hypothetical protein
LDFFDAWEIFEAPVLVEPDLRYDYGETRYLGIGFLRNIIVLVVFTERNGDTIRIISLRKAKRDEREKFFKYLQNQLGTAGGDER